MGCILCWIDRSIEIGRHGALTNTAPHVCAGDFDVRAPAYDLARFVLALEDADCWLNPTQLRCVGRGEPKAVHLAQAEQKIGVTPRSRVRVIRAEHNQESPGTLCRRIGRCLNNFE